MEAELGVHLDRRKGNKTSEDMITMMTYSFNKLKMKTTVKINKSN